jgi:cellulose synthase/poly-beta-1,6-N-acetylglucosamine synthase-like glycosyltransferase
MEYIIVIPSYNRAETCRDKTLAVLSKYKIPSNLIHVIVANTEQAELYKNTLDPQTYNKILVGVPGLVNVRNWIFAHFPKGKHIVSCDDDIKGFIEYSARTKRHEVPLRSLKDVIRRGFSECKKANCHLWGVYPSANGFFMKPTVSTDLKFVIGNFFGFINPGSSFQLKSAGSKEDYEMSIMFFIQDKAVVRLNFISPKTSIYTEPGGLQSDGKRHKMQKDSVRYLTKKYPQYVKINTTRKSIYPEIRLVDTTKQKNVTRKNKKD